MCKKQPFKKHEIISVFYFKQPTYNPQFEVGKPYTDVRKESYRENISVGDGNRLIKNPIFNNGTRYPSSVQKFSNANNNRLHPTQKPVSLLEYLIKTYTTEGETVLDNCMGSGSTGVAAVNTGRDFIGIELDENYFNIAQKRINQAIQDKGGV